MVGLYISSTESFSGKTALCLGLALRFRDEGFKVGYFKPVNTAVRRLKGQAFDEDAAFIQKVLDLPEPAEVLSPLFLDEPTRDAILRDKRPDLESRLKEVYTNLAIGRDIIVIEGGGHINQGFLADLPAYRVAKLLEAKSLIITPYISDFSLDGLLAFRDRLKEGMLGCVLNSVPEEGWARAKEKVIPFLEKQGIAVFAALPRERVLLSISVGQLAEVLGAQILTAAHRSSQLVENLMIGAMSADHALSYFRRVPRKAVITGGDRPDIQLAALETPTSCLILTGNLYPSPLVLGRAEELEVPVLLATQDTLAAVETIERFFGKTSFHQEEKISRFQELLSQHFDFARLYKALGLR